MSVERLLIGSNQFETDTTGTSGDATLEGMSPSSNGPERDAVGRSGSIVEAVAAGDAQFTELDPDERKLAHALIDERIARRAADARFGLPDSPADR